MFEYLVERGAEITLDDEQPEDRDLIAAMLQRRQEWIDQAALLAHDWRLSLIAVRTIHEYVVGFNWSAVLDSFNINRHQMLLAYFTTCGGIASTCQINISKSNVSTSLTDSAMRSPAVELECLALSTTHNHCWERFPAYLNLLLQRAVLVSPL